MGITPQGVDLGSAYAEIVVDFSQVERDANAAFANIERGLSEKLNRIGKDIELVGRNMTLLLSPVSAFVAQGVFAFASFDEVMVEIQARTNATADDMARVKDVALDMGKNTMFSATEASQAMLEMLSSGSSLEEAIAALPDVLNLAAVGNIALGESADAVTDILAQYQADISRSTEVVDALSAASQSSSATIPDLIAAFQNVGPVAKMFGLDIDETAAVLAVFAENGIKGSEAGTQLKSMLLNMSRDTKEVQNAWNDLGTSLYDAEGNMRNIDDVIADINEGLKDKTPEERQRIITDLAGSYGVMGMEALLAADGIDGMMTKMDESTDAADIASAKMNSWKGIVNQVKSSIETLSITTIGPLVDEYLKPLATEVIGIINTFNDWMIANPELAEQLGVLLGVLAVLGPTIFGVGTAITFLTGPVGLITLGILAAVLAIGALWIAYEQNFMGFGDGVDAVAAVVIPALESIADWIGKIVDAIMEGDWDEASKLLSQGLETALDTLGDMALDAGAWLNSAILEPLAEALAAVDWGQALADAGDILLGILQVIGAAASTIGTWVYDNIIAPIAGALDEWISSGQAEEDLRAFGEGVLSVIQSGLAFAEDGMNWVKENLLDPIIAKLVDYVESGDLAEDVREFGEWYRNALIEVIKFAADGMEWIKDNITLPVINALVDWVTNDAVDDLTAFGSGVLDAIKAVIDLHEDATDFINDNIITPFIEGFTGLDLTALADAAALIGTGIMDAIGGAVSAGISIVEGIVKGAINAIIPDNVSLSIPSITIPNPLPGDNDYRIGGGSVSISLPNPFQGYAEGGEYPAGQPRMVGERGIEMDVPRASGMVIANDQLATALNVLTGGNLRGLMGDAGAGDGAGGGITINGGVNITIDETAIPAGATARDVGEAVWAKFTEAMRAKGGGTVGAGA